MGQKRYRIRYKRVFLAVGVLCLFLAGILMVYLSFNPIVLKASEYPVEINDSFKEEEAIFILFGNHEDLEVDGKVDTSQLGEYEVTYKLHDHTKKLCVKVEDTKVPDLQIQDVKTDLYRELEPADFVKECKDATDVSFSFESKEGLDQEGRHDVVIVAEDQGGNQTKKRARLERCKDTQKPTIKVPEKKLKFKQGKEPDFTEDVSVSDDLDSKPQLDVDTSDLNFSKPGTYTLIYTCKDRSGNEATQKRKVEILENEELTQKIVYLTFDDGPSKNTERILKILDKYKVKATFFVTGNGQDYNDWIKKAYKKGHTIGLHTYTHDFSSVYSSVDAYFEDLKQIQDMVEDLTGEKSYVIRFPGGSSNAISRQYSEGIMSTLVQEVQDRGFQYFDWNCDSTDASGNGIPVSQLIDCATSCDAQHINILMHDTAAKDTTVEALPKIIEHYKKEGYIFKALNTDSFAPHHDVIN